MSILPIVLGAIGTFCAADIATRYFPVVKRYTVPAPDTLKIAHISDLHNRRFGHNQKRIVKPLAGFQPDIIVITGDLLNKHTPGRYEAAMTFAKEAVAIAPVYFCTGNHDHGAENFLQKLTEIGVHVLSDESMPLGETMELCGIQDRTEGNFFRELTLPENLSELIHNERYSIVLMHRPEGLTNCAEAGVNLLLSGHEHGGFFRIGKLALISSDEGLFPQYAGGCKKCGGCTEIISRGLGGWRLFNPPEIGLIELKKQ